MLTIGKIKIKYLALVLFLAGLGMFSTVMAQSIDPCNDWVVGYSPVVQDCCPNPYSSTCFALGYAGMVGPNPIYLQSWDTCGVPASCSEQSMSNTCPDGSTLITRYTITNQGCFSAVCNNPPTYSQCCVAGYSSAPSCPPICTPNCSCAASTCIGHTCSDGCSGFCNGTLAGCSEVLTVTKSGAGTGTVTSADNKINCGAACSAGYTAGAATTLTAAAGAQSIFAGWTGDCSGLGSCSLTMLVDKNVGAVFNKTCKDNSAYCTVASECCGNYCCNNSCSSSCCANGDSCTSGQQCCTGRCCGGFCAACCNNSQTCSSNNDCCSGYCNSSNVCAALANPSNIRVTDSGLTDYGSGYIGNISDPVSYTGYGVHAYQNLAWDNVPGATYYSFYYSSRSLGSVWGINQARFYRALNTQNYVLPLAINSGSNLTIKACNDVSCSAGASFSSADTVIENPNVITCFDVTNSGFKVRVRSTQGNSAGLAGNPSVLFRNKSAFTNLNSGNSGIRVQIRNMDDSVRGSGYNTGWVNTGTASTYIVNAYNGTANEFLPGDWTVTGLTSNTAYKVCSQTRNSSAVFYRPGPADTQWNCVACATADNGDHDDCTIAVCNKKGSCEVTQIITNCVNGDKCCPAGCTNQTDSDCTGVCNLRNLTCPSQAKPGSGISLSYEFWGTGGDKPYEVRSVYGPTDGEWGAINLDSGLWCSKPVMENFEANIWHPEVKVFTFPVNAVIGQSYTYTVKCEGSSDPVNALCSNDANVLTCNIKAGDGCLPNCPNPNTYCSGKEPDDGCGSKCPTGTKVPSCPPTDTYCPGQEPDNGCGSKCPTGTQPCLPEVPKPKVLNHTQTQMTWQWPQAERAASYEVVLFDEDWNLVDSLNIGNVLTWTANDLIPNSVYILYLRAVNGYGNQEAVIWHVTSIETPVSLSLLSRTSTTIAIRAEGVFTNLVVPSSGIRFREVTTDKIRDYDSNKTWQATDLNPNTNYTFTSQVRNQDGLQDNTGDFSIENWQQTFTTCSSCPPANTYCGGQEPKDSCNNPCPAGTKIPSCPQANTYCPGDEPDNGCGSKCPAGTKDCSPLDIGNLQVQNHSQTQMSWRWNASAGTVTTTVIIYDVDWNVVNPGVAIGTATTWTENNLQPNTSYNIFVRVINDYGFKEASLISATSLEDPINIICLSRTATNITVQANGIFTNLDIPNTGLRFRELNTSQLRDYAGSRTWTVSNLNPSTCYNFTVQGRNQDGLNDGTNDYSIENWQQQCCTMARPDVLDGSLTYNPGDYCNAPLRPRFAWTFVSTNPNSTQAAFQLQVATDNGFNNIVYDSCDPAPGTCSDGHVSNSYALITPLPSYNTMYHWRVKVWDSFGIESDWHNGDSFKTPKHAYPKPDFTASPPVPAVDEITLFCSTMELPSCAVEQSACYNNAQQLISCSGYTFSWAFPAGTTYVTSTPQTKNPRVKFDAMGLKNVSLTILDLSLNESCTASKTVRTVPSPTYRER